MSGIQGWLVGLRPRSAASGGAQVSRDTSVGDGDLALSGLADPVPSLDAPQGPDAGVPADAASGDPRDALLRRSEPAAGIGSHAARGMAWTLGGQWAALVLHLGSTYVLARLIGPEAYGLVGAVLAITLFADQFKTLGLSQALIQSEHVTHRQASALFWINVGIGCALTVIVAAASPLIGLLYHRSEVTDIALVLSISFVFTGLSVQHNGILLRQMKFKAIAVRSVVVKITSVTTMIIAALLGADYWSLVYGQLAYAIAGMVVVWTACSWRPSRPARGADIGSMLKFGGGVSTSSILNFASRNLDNVVIGNQLGAGPLGLYGRAYSILMLPLQQLCAPIGSVAQPALAALWGEPERYRRFYVAVIRVLALVGMPVVVFLIVMADEVVLFMLGPKFADASDVFRMLAAAGLFQVVAFSNGWLYNTSGRSWAGARWALISRPLLIASFFVGVRWGILGVATAYAVMQLALMPFAFRSAMRGTPITFPDVWQGAWRGLLLGALVGIVGLGVKYVAPDWPSIGVLGSAAAAAAVCYVAALAAWPGARGDLIAIARRRPPKVTT